MEFDSAVIVDFMNEAWQPSYADPSLFLPRNPRVTAFQASPHLSYLHSRLQVCSQPRRKNTVNLAGENFQYCRQAGDPQSRVHGHRHTRSVWRCAGRRSWFWLAADHPKEVSGADLLHAIWCSIQENGMEIPYPQCEVRILNENYRQS